MLNSKEYIFSLDTEKNIKCLNCDKKIKSNIKNNIDYNDINKSINNINNYFINRGETCK